MICPVQRPLFVGSSHQKKGSNEHRSIANYWPAELDEDSEPGLPPVKDLFNLDDNDVEIVSHASSVPLTDFGDSSSVNDLQIGIDNDLPDDNSPPKARASRKRTRSVVLSNESACGHESAARPARKSLKKAKVRFGYFYAGSVA